MIPHADSLSRVPPTDEEDKFGQVNQVKPKDEKISSIGIMKSVEQLVGHQENEVVLRNWIQSGNNLKGKI